MITSGINAIRRPDHREELDFSKTIIFYRDMYLQDIVNDDNTSGDVSSFCKGFTKLFKWMNQINGMPLAQSLHMTPNDTSFRYEWRDIQRTSQHFELSISGI